MVKKYVARDWSGFGLLLVALILPALGMALPLAGELHHMDELTELTKASVVGEGWLSTRRCSVAVNAPCAGGPQVGSPCMDGDVPRSLCVGQAADETCPTGFGFGWDNCSGEKQTDCPEGVVHECKLQAGLGSRWRLPPIAPMAPLPGGCGKVWECIR